MPLVQLLYFSEPSTAIGSYELTGILERSRANNERDAITGLLCFTRSHFVQALEGERDAVNAAYLRITRDTRHHHPIVIAYEYSDVRRFARWRMGFVGLAAFHQDLIERHALGRIEAPADWPPRNVMPMMIELAARLAAAEDQHSTQI